MIFSNLSLRAKLCVFTIIAILISFSILITLFVSQSSSLIISHEKEEGIPYELSKATEDLNNELDKILIIAKGMQDATIQEFIDNGEQDTAKLYKHLTEIKNIHNLNAAFFASTTTNNYHVYDKLIKKLSSNDNKDEWFFGFLNRSNDYEYNLDFDENTKSLGIFINYKFKKNGKVQSIQGVGLSLDSLASTIDKYNTHNANKLMLIDRNGNLALGCDKSKVGKPFSEDMYIQKSIALIKKDNIIDADIDGKSYIIASKYIPAVDWTVVILVPKSNLLAKVSDMAWVEIIICLCVLSVIVFLCLLIVNTTLLPLKDISVKMKNLGTDLTFKADYTKKNEIGYIARSINSFVSNIHDVVVNSKDLATKVSESSKEIVGNTNTAKGELNNQKGHISDIADSIGQLSIAANNIAQQTEMASEATNEAAQITEAGNARIQEMLSSISSVTNRVIDANEKVDKLKTACSKIEMILGVISAVSEQTNLLALNAAIEAARAGEAGRGFAVVADEVRGLAKKTQDSTNEIANVITELQNSSLDLAKSIEESKVEAEGSVELANRNANVLNEILEVSQNLNSMIAQISHSTEEQSNLALRLKEHSEIVEQITEKVCMIMDIESDLANNMASNVEEQNKELNKFVV